LPISDLRIKLFAVLKLKRKKKVSFLNFTGKLVYRTIPRFLQFWSLVRKIIWRMLSRWEMDKRTIKFVSLSSTC